MIVKIHMKLSIWVRHLGKIPKKSRFVFGVASLNHLFTDWECFWHTKSYPRELKMSMILKTLYPRNKTWPKKTTTRTMLETGTKTNTMTIDNGKDRYIKITPSRSYHGDFSCLKYLIIASLLGNLPLLFIRCLWSHIQDIIQLFPHVSLTKYVGLYAGCSALTSALFSPAKKTGVYILPKNWVFYKTPF